MKKILRGLLLLIIIILVFFIGTKSIDRKYDFKPEIKIPKINENTKIVDKLKKEYNNNDIVGVIEIPNLFKEIVLQTSDNDYYLNHNIKKEEDKYGGTFLDYRNDILNDKKLLIYGHSDMEITLSFNKLSNYNNQEFYEKNKYIYLYTNDKKYKYEIFSSYIENKDFDYVNLKSYNGLTYKEHLNKLKNKSKIKSNIVLEDESHILILQTCSNGDPNHKYQLVIGLLTE